VLLLLLLLLPRGARVAGRRPEGLRGGLGGEPQHLGGRGAGRGQHGEAGRRDPRRGGGRPEQAGQGVGDAPAPVIHLQVVEAAVHVKNRMLIM
jgi:hypothetical protein